MNKTKCIQCKNEINKTHPQFTYYYDINSPYSISSLFLDTMTFPLSFWQVINEINSNGPEFETTEIIDICSYKCIVILENYHINQIVDKPSKKMKLF